MHITSLAHVHVHVGKLTSTLLSTLALVQVLQWTGNACVAGAFALEIPLANPAKMVSLLLLVRHDHNKIMGP